MLSQGNAEILLPRKKKWCTFSMPSSSVQGRGGAGAYLQQSTGERWGTPWTGRQSIAGEHKDTNNHIHLTIMFLDRGRKKEYPERTNSAINCTIVQPFTLSHFDIAFSWSSLCNTICQYKKGKTYHTFLFHHGFIILHPRNRIIFERPNMNLIENL
ncbi:hypothetical protein XENORESO_015964 [Xenotaenia resolanae]|uniref:Uncharacterized protein n=1 Tax=Xenotaenia resolanae TaxID=208358 RepID=A0ABV0X5J0_9TELE